MNKTIVTGNVGAEDARLGALPTGTPVLNFNFAVNETYRDKDGNRQTQTTWFKAAYFGDRAKNVAQYVTTGKRLLLVGRVKAKAWKGEDGEPKADLILTVDELELEGAGAANRNADETSDADASGAINDAEDLFPSES